VCLAEEDSMTNFYNSSENFMARPSLYRVWVPLHDDGKAPLISIWIDPIMTAFEPEPHRESIEISRANEGELIEDIEDPRRCSVVSAIAFEVAA
jgi:hypothetical protein